MTWETILKRAITTHEDYKKYFSFFNGEALPLGSVVEYRGFSKVTLPMGMMKTVAVRELIRGKQYKIIGANYSSSIGDYVLVAEDLSLAGSFVSLPMKIMMKYGRKFKVISRGSEEQRNFSVPRKK